MWGAEGFGCSRPRSPPQRYKVQFNKGEHGFDNEAMNMKTIFRAVGPAFKKGLVVEPFESVNVYALLCELLGITPEPHDGSLEVTKPMLRQSGNTGSNGEQREWQRAPAATVGSRNSNRHQKWQWAPGVHRERHREGHSGPAGWARRVVKAAWVRREGGCDCRDAHLRGRGKSCVFSAQERGRPWEQRRALSTHEGRAAPHPCQKLAFAPFSRCLSTRIWRRRDYLKQKIL